MDPYRVALFGHRDLYHHKKAEQGLLPILSELIRTKPFVEIYIGRNGEFDLFAASVVKRAQKLFGNENSVMTLVLPYLRRDVEYYELYYDNILIPKCIEKTHPKGAITKRNKWMVEESDLVICYVDHNSGGAYTAMKYAQKLGKAIVNLALIDEDNNGIFMY